MLSIKKSTLSDLVIVQIIKFFDVSLWLALLIISRTVVIFSCNNFHLYGVSHLKATENGNSLLLKMDNRSNKGL